MDALDLTDLSLTNCEKIADVLRTSKPHLVTQLLNPTLRGLAPLDALSFGEKVQELRDLKLVEQDSTDWTRLGRRVQGFL